jgi:hypothetical protein
VIEDGVIVSKTTVERIPRFHVTEKGFYVCDRHCSRLPADCTGIPISGDKFKEKFKMADFLNEHSIGQPVEKSDEPVKKKRGRKPRAEMVEQEVAV